MDKLVYTRNTLHTTQHTQYPAFWNEEWLKQAIDELDTRKMTPEERAYFARVTATNAEAVKAEKQRIEEAEERKEIAVKTLVVKKAINRGKLTIEEIAEDNGVSIDFVRQIQQELSTHAG